MVIVRVKGGIGNQMFQYALGRHIALRQGSELLIDTRHYRRMKFRYLKYRLTGKDITLIYRDYDLDNFNIAARLLNRKEIRQIALKKEDKKFRSDHIKVFNEEGNYSFDESLLHLKEPVYLTGHWQNLNYIREIRDTLRKDFSLIKPFEGINSERFERIKARNSVSVHIRLGDFRRFGRQLTKAEYYLKAMQTIGEKVKDPYFVFFSDEPDWVKENLQTDAPSEIVSGNVMHDSYLDIALMKNCKHNIISNSTFSWWAAFLNDSENAQVLYPKDWTGNEIFRPEILMPDDWQMLG